MKLLIDECVLAQTATLLRHNGFSVMTIQELGKSSATNGAVIGIARKEDAVLITNNLDFANLDQYPLSTHTGVILLRPRFDTDDAIKGIHNILLKVLKEFPPTKLSRSLVIVDRDKYRIRTND